MEYIKIKHPFDKDEIVDEDIVLILGFFDGVHSGHQNVIKKGIEIAKERNLKAALMTFNRSPSLVYSKIDMEEYTYLSKKNQKQKLVKDLGIDIYYEVFFNSEFGHLHPQDFVDQYIVDWNAKVVVAGFDYTYGKPEIASMKHLAGYAKNRFEIVCVEEERKDGEGVSSTRIKQYIKAGKIEKANEMLGYQYQTQGFVIHGEARGRHLGFPTANVYPLPYTLLPKVGIYAVWFTVNGRKHPGMASIGYNVTFGKRETVSVEVNIFDFSGEIYGEDVKIDWVSYLRGEIKFASADELVEQLEKDKQAVRKILNNN